MGDLVPNGDPDLALFIFIMLIGFVIGTMGHVANSRLMVILGIALIFVGTVLLPLLIFGNGQ
ncbi:MAG: hypothetical protein WKF94_07775 [Solirubrobacteraceae bacterium]